MFLSITLINKWKWALAFQTKVVRYLRSEPKTKALSRLQILKTYHTWRAPETQMTRTWLAWRASNRIVLWEALTTVTCWEVVASPGRTTTWIPLQVRMELWSMEWCNREAALQVREAPATLVVMPRHRLTNPSPALQPSSIWLKPSPSVEAQAILLMALHLVRPWVYSSQKCMNSNKSLISCWTRRRNMLKRSNN